MAAEGIDDADRTWNRNSPPIERAIEIEDDEVVRLKPGWYGSYRPPSTDRFKTLVGVLPSITATTVSAHNRSIRSIASYV